MERNELKDIIEQYIDKHSLRAIRDIIIEICFDKSQHVRENYQDTKLANAWSSIGESYWNLNFSDSPRRLESNRDILG